jgi:hypothetical protein
MWMGGLMMCWYWHCYRQKLVRSNRTFNHFLFSKFVCYVYGMGWDRKSGVRTRPRIPWCNYGHLDTLTRDSLFPQESLH